MLAPETLLQGRYFIVRQLGQGGMGAVYEALDQRLDTTVALKETLFADERLRRQFEREARLLARLHHPALPRVSDHFPEGDGQFLVMQFIAGDDLAEMMARKNGPFPPHQVLTWADQLLDALDYLHTQDPQIVHRDIKPQNLKLTARGQIILLDFGLAKGQAGEISRITTAASIFGYTPNYAPLEQIQGLGTDPRSDLYALAATLYHLMTGVKPPDALTRAAALVNGQPDPLRLASEENDSVTPEIDVVLRKAMSQNRDQRYANAVDMRKALHSTDQAATVANRGEAKTVLFPPSVPAVRTPTQQIPRQATVSTGETTVVRRNVVERKQLLPWAMSAAAVVVLAGGVWGLYALQHRKGPAVQSLPNTTTTSESPAVAAPTAAASDNASSQPPGEPKPAAIQPHPASAEKTVVRKKEKPAQPAEKKRTATVPVPKPAERVGEGHAEERTSAESPQPNVPKVNLPNVPRRARGGTRTTADGTVIRNLPDGTQVIITPDGTRVIVTPDGRRHVFRPGQKKVPGRVPPLP
jgi:serine/threonine protein kinase